MADVVNRTTKQYLQSVNTPDFSPAQWIINPDLSAVAGQPSKYWTITGDVITLQNAGEQAATDAALAAAAATDAREATKDPVAATLDPVGMQTRALIEIFNQRDNYLTNRIAELQSALDAVKASTGAADNIRAAIPASWLATNTRLRSDAITDYRASIDAGEVDAGE
jgi:hypothetical protein